MAHSHFSQKKLGATPSKVARAPTPQESALYTYDMLRSLRRFAIRHRQQHLARLIEQAAVEARAIIERPVQAADV